MRHRPRAPRRRRIGIAQGVVVLIGVYTLIGAGIGAATGWLLIGMLVGLCCGFCAAAAILLISGASVTAEPAAPAVVRQNRIRLAKQVPPLAVRRSSLRPNLPNFHDHSF